MTRIVFFGTPSFAEKCLVALHTKYNIIGVVTQPDRPSGRGKTIKSSEVKTSATNFNIPTITPTNINTVSSIDKITKWKPDLIVVAAYGQILKHEILKIPNNGCLNLHASLLPKYRGASPISASIINNDFYTGVTIMQMDNGMDSGPILSQQKININPSDTTGTLTKKLAHIGSNLLCETIPYYISGISQPITQDETLVSYAPKLSKDSGHLDFNKTASYLEKQIRAMSPWPGTYTLFNKERIKIIEAEVTTGNLPIGQVNKIDKSVLVGTQEGLLKLLQIQPPGKRVMSALDYSQGHKSFVNSILL